MRLTKRDTLILGAATAAMSTGIAALSQAQAEDAQEKAELIVSDTMAVIHLDDGTNIPMPLPDQYIGAAYSDAACDLDLDYSGEIAGVSVTRNTYKLMRRNNLIDYTIVGKGSDEGRFVPTFMGQRLYVPGTKLARKV